MEQLLPERFFDILIISINFSLILMILIQKCKAMNILKKTWQIGIINIIFSFLLGIPFAVNFYNLGIVDAIWVGIISYIGAPTIYDVLKNQTIINIRPNSLSDSGNKKVNEIIRP